VVLILVLLCSQFRLWFHELSILVEFLIFWHFSVTAAGWVISDVIFLLHMGDLVVLIVF
jgi:hypothetical protein